MKRKNLLLIALVGLLCSLALLYLSDGVRAALSGYNQEDLQGVLDEQAAAQPLFPQAENTLYQMDLHLDVLTNTLYGQSSVGTINTAGKVLSEIWLGLYPQVFQSREESPAPAGAYYQGFSAGNLKVKQIEINGHSSEYLTEGMALKVLLPVDVLPEEAIRIDISWQAHIPQSGYRYGSKDGVFMLGHTYPVLHVLTGAGWQVPSNSSFGDPFCLAAADYLVRINVPQEYSLATSGEEIISLALDNGRVSHLLQAEKVRDFCITAFTAYETLQEQGDVYTLSCHVPLGKGTVGTALLQEAVRVLEYYNRLWGSYPYPELKIVVTPMQGFAGMEYAGVIYIASNQLNTPGLTRLLAHEIAHQWWYGVVGNDQYHEPWLDEGLACYAASLYMAHRDNRPIPAHASIRPLNLKRSLADFTSQERYLAEIYQGGESFWWALEVELGQERVQKILRSYLAQYRYQLASTSDLKRLISQEAHRDLTSFFHEWSL